MRWHYAGRNSQHHAALLHRPLRHRRRLRGRHLRHHAPDLHHGGVTNNPIAFSNATDVVAPPAGARPGLQPHLRQPLTGQPQLGQCHGGRRARLPRHLLCVTTTDFLLGVSSTRVLLTITSPPPSKCITRSWRLTARDPPPQCRQRYVCRCGRAHNVQHLPARRDAQRVCGDGNPAYQQTLNGPGGTFVDNDGNLYIADSGNSRIQFVPKKNRTSFRPIHDSELCLYDCIFRYSPSHWCHGRQ